MDWVWTHAGAIWALVLEHIGLCVPPIVLGFVISIPIGWWASRNAAVRSVLLTVGNILYTIPGLALVVLIPVILGVPLLNPVNIVVALTIYALAIMVRSAADAFASVPEGVQQSATAQGFSGAQRFLTVELPLAGPVLLAGIRVVSVSTISLATVGSLVGISSLGDLFTDGFQRNFLLEAVVGFVLVLVLAAVFDVLLSTAGRLLMPWTRGARLSSRAARTVAMPLAPAVRR
ncbi:ABC transporter permease [Amnibacterium sp. CER49]|uniref:ABC transporter permease n=1 Tax=Amnibacterium sp. CER49 TaxID=3039161 RepID=UPI00244B845F|nr:ABC transporter permease [Amnibacterium sp. CER49]MDH2442466.1 ABC transporter permease [Amnibacterium sp. CER49]